MLKRLTLPAKIYNYPGWLLDLIVLAAPKAFGNHAPTQEECREYVDAHISAMLAVAIGWDAYEDVQVQLPRTFTFAFKSLCEVWADNAWRTFSYHDETVIEPLIKKYEIAVRKVPSVQSKPDIWSAQCKGRGVLADSKSRAIALLLIKLTNANAVWTDGAALTELISTPTPAAVEEPKGPDNCHINQEEQEAEAALESAWRSFQREVAEHRLVPTLLTLERIVEARKNLGFNPK